MVRAVTYTSASCCATAWKVASGRPNCSRVRRCSAVSASAPAITPSATAAAPASAHISMSATPPGSTTTGVTDVQATVYSGAPVEVVVRMSVAPSPDGSTSATPPSVRDEDQPRLLGVGNAARPPVDRPS